VGASTRLSPRTTNVGQSLSNLLVIDIFGNRFRDAHRPAGGVGRGRGQAPACGVRGVAGPAVRAALEDQVYTAGRVIGEQAAGERFEMCETKQDKMRHFLSMLPICCYIIYNAFYGSNLRTRQMCLAAVSSRPGGLNASHGRLMQTIAAILVFPHPRCARVAASVGND
jgi:hypothetical protein